MPEQKEHHHSRRGWPGRARMSRSRSAEEDAFGSSSSRNEKQEEDLNPPIEGTPPSTPGNTPPKKLWERQYRSFLTRKKLEAQSDGSTAAASASAGASPGSLRRMQGGHGPKNKMPLIPNIQEPGRDSSVRGGKFFHSFFPRQQESQREGRRRVKSMDCLDDTMRKGVKTTSESSMAIATSELARSPKGPATAALADDKASELRSSTSLPVLSQDPPPTDMKKAFTEFHNATSSSVDSTAAFLGDEPSAHTSYWRPQFMLHNNPSAACSAQPFLTTPSTLLPPMREMQNYRGNKASAPLDSMPQPPNFVVSQSLPTVDENVKMIFNKSTCILKPLQSSDAWQPGRRYLIAPGALTACPLQVISILGSNTTHPNSRKSVFGAIALGEAIAYTGNGKWSACAMVLRQNYLLEYDPEANMRGLPRGYAHLELATCTPHAEFRDALELDFYGSPCAKADKRTLTLRLKRHEDRDNWIARLNEAAKLKVEDLYEFESDVAFGEGRYAKVHPARRKYVDGDSRKPASNPNSVKASHMNGEKYDCAIKVVNKSQFWRRVLKKEERADTLVREIAVQATATARCGKVPSFVRIQGFFETADTVVVEMELLKGTDLFEYISSRGFLQEQEAAIVMRDVLTSLDAMSRVGLAHRDIKPANIFMCEDERHGCSAKVGDFGMATFVDVDGLVRGRCGTPGYVAPEIFLAEKYGGYGNKVDVFSAGVTLYVMLCGYEPFYGETESELRAANKSAIVEFPDSDWKSVSRLGRDLIKSMMDPDPRKRIGVHEALNHEWVRKYCGKKAAAGSDREVLSSLPSPEGTACTIS